MVYFPIHILDSKLLLCLLFQLKSVGLATNFNIQNVLVAPLDWGLGHATRCISLIRALVNCGHHVIIAADGPQRALLENEFPFLRFIELPGYRVRYSTRKWLLPLTLLQQLPRLWNSVQKEHRWLQKAIDQYDIHLVLSDNRYGLYTTKVPCVFITHQLTIKATYKWLEWLMQRLNYYYINRYTACWVPDMAGKQNLAGILSHPAQLPRVPVRYMGVPARFEPVIAMQKYSYAFMLSGPEPQRSILEKKILAQIHELEAPVLLVRGMPGTADVLEVPAFVTVYNHLPTAELQKALLESGMIICRSGYTSIVELLLLHKKAILVPTPGQTEQEYLALHMQQQSYAMCLPQDLFNLQRAVMAARVFSYHFPHLDLFDEARLTALLHDLAGR